METQAFVKEICTTATQLWIKIGALLVDVCEEDEVAQLAGNPPGIANIPLSRYDECYAPCNSNRLQITVTKTAI